MTSAAPTSTNRPTAQVVWGVAEPAPLTGVTLTPDGSSVIYFAEAGTKRSLRALEARTGKVIWEADLSDRGSAVNQTITPPVVVGDSVAAVIADGEGGRIRVFDVRTGARVGRDSPVAVEIDQLGPCPDGRAWCFIGDTRMHHPLPTLRYAPGDRSFSPAKAGLVVVNPVADPFEYIVDGEVQWTLDPQSIMKTCPRYVCMRGWATIGEVTAMGFRESGKGGHLVSTTVAAFTTRTGRKRWVSPGDQLAQVATQSGHFSHEGDVYVFTPEPARVNGTYDDFDVRLLYGGRLRALDPETGKERWSVALGRSRFQPRLTRLSNGDLIFDEGNQTRLLDAASGDVIADRDLSYWRSSTDGPPGRRARLDITEPMIDAGPSDTVREPIPDEIGVQAGDLRIVAQPNGVYAYR